VLAAKSVRLSPEWRGFFRRLAVNYAGCRHYHAVGFHRRLDRDHTVRHIVGHLRRVALQRIAIAAAGRAVAAARTLCLCYLVG
jgi:hypothetical protein